MKKRTYGALQHEWRRALSDTFHLHMQVCDGIGNNPCVTPIGTFEALERYSDLDTAIDFASAIAHEVRVHTEKQAAGCYCVADIVARLWRTRDGRETLAYFARHGIKYTPPTRPALLPG
jgi:hypothetical protein